MRWSLLLKISVAVVLSLAPAAVRAADFKGKRIEIIVPSSEGGGTDIWARIFAPLLEKNLPGNPTVVVRNVPGGASIAGGNQFQSSARPDGQMVFALAGSTIMGYLFRDNRVRFKLEEWIPVVASPMGTVVYAAPSLGVKSPGDISQLKGKELVYGSREPTGTDLPMLLAFDMLGLELKPVYGIRGRGDGRLGFERGEFTIDRQTAIAYEQGVVPLVKAGKAVPLFSFGVFDPQGNLQRDPNFPDIPHFGEAYKTVHGKEPSGPAWEAWKTFMAAGYGVSKAFVLPAKTPRDIVEAYETAIATVLKDPDSREKLKDEIGDYPQGLGKEAMAFVKQASTIDAESEKWIRDWLTTKHGVKF
jgi:Tripartite tricarboxylate transporter family receptor